MLQKLARRLPGPSRHKPLRSLLLFLAGFVLLLQPGRAQTPDVAAIRPGDLALQLASSSPSTLGVDAAAIESVLCNKAGVAECGITLNHAGSPTLVLTVTRVDPEPQGGAAVLVVANSLVLGGTGFSTDCGTWSYQITLDEMPQPASWLALYPAPGPTSDTAPFAGSFTLAARLRFTSESGDQTVTLAETLKFHLNGSWTTAVNKALPPGASSLMLMVDRAGNQWSPVPTVLEGGGAPIQANCGNTPGPPTLKCPACIAVLNGPPAQTAVPLGSSGSPYGYYEALPAGYDTATDPWPLVIFLHGEGERGDGTSQLSRVLSRGVPWNVYAGEPYPFVLISPQTADWWNVGTIDTLVEFVKTRYRVDVNRIYLTGIEMGGAGVWDYAKAHAGKLAAIVPVSGGSFPDGPALAGLPTWAFHAWGDGFVSADASVLFVEAIAGARAGGPPLDMLASYPGSYSGLPGPSQTSDQDRTASFESGSWVFRNGATPPADRLGLTLYQDTNHDAWTRAYANPALWSWLLAQGHASCSGSRLIVPTAAGTAEGSPWFPLNDAFDAQPGLGLAGEPTGGSGGSDAPYLPGQAGYIDFGPDWNQARITSTWTRYRAWSLGDQTPYAELWWDDDIDSVNDGIGETRLNFNSAEGLATGLTEPWVRDRDRCLEPVTPRARYLLLRAPAEMTNRAKEYAILGFLEPGATP